MTCLLKGARNSGFRLQPRKRKSQDTAIVRDSSIRNVVPDFATRCLENPATFWSAETSSHNFASGDLAKMFDAVDSVVARNSMDQIRLVFIWVLFADISALMPQATRVTQLKSIASYVARSSSSNNDADQVYDLFRTFIKKGKPWSHLTTLYGDWLLVGLPTYVSQTL